MNWKLIFQLSAFGFIMALATVSLIPEKFEFAFWLPIFVFCAYVIAKVCSGKYFLHGFLVSIVNSVWITAAHVISYKSYAENHMDMVEAFKNFPLANHPRVLMILMGPFFGVGFGLVLGLFTFIASKIVAPKARAV